MTINKNIEEGKTIFDPACGSGRMLLASAKINRRLKYYGADVDLTCCKMTVLNMLINSLPGEIAWMNTLSCEHWKSWHIRLIRNEKNHFIPYYFTTGPGQTGLISSIKKMKEEIKPLPNHRYKGPELKEGHQFILF